MLESITSYLRLRQPQLTWPAAEAYNLWAEEYDNQPGNLMLRLDRQLLDHYLTFLHLKDKVVVDIGCGTGRHWPGFMLENPVRLTGFDVSIGMLNKLKHKFPAAECYQVHEHSMLPFSESSVDVIISTLTIAHISDMYPVIREWERILSSGGLIYISDFHPHVLKMGGKRSFKVKGKSRIVQNFIHETASLQQQFADHNIDLLDKREILLTDNLKAEYRSQNAMSVYQKFFGMPLIYGMLLKKKS